MLNIKKVKGILKARLGLQMPQYSYLNGSFTYPLDWQLKLNNDFYLNNFSILNTNNKLTTDKLISGNTMGNIGKAADFGRHLLFNNNNNSNLTLGLNNSYDAISSSLMSFSPIGTIIGGAMKVGAFVGDGLASMGLGTDLMTTTDLILDSNFFKLTPTGLINAIGSKKTLNFDINQNTLESVGGSYLGSVNTINDAVSKANKKFGLLSSKGRRKANQLIDDARNQQNIMTNIAQDAEDLRSFAQSNFDYNSINYQNKINGGYNMKYGIVAKEGAKLNDHINLETKDIGWEPIITKKWKAQIVSKHKDGGNIEESWIPVISDRPIFEPIITMKLGGKTEKLEAPKIEETSQKNVIPEGALHKNKHHMDNDENITKKGIPVIDNNGEQLAEIELNEIIFTLEVTKKLEELYSKYYTEESSLKDKDKAAIEAGLLLVKEILFNTEDRTGLINTLKEGGKLDGIS